jgi:hypothetical protein
MSMGPVTDRARVLRVSSDIIQECSHVLVSIEVSGVGIDGKNKERIFERFFTTKSAGTGIGLAICRSIIEAYGGSLRACLSGHFAEPWLLNDNIPNDILLPAASGAIALQGYIQVLD